MKLLAAYGMLLLTSITLQGQNSQNVKTKTGKMNTNVRQAQAINKAVQNGDAGVRALVTENYKQHTPNIPDGRKGLIGLVTKIRNKEIPAPEIKNIRVFQDGDYVVLHHDVHWPNRKAMVEIFRFENGLAAEHWSGISDHPEKTANGHTMVDGATEVKDRQLTSQNKAFVRSFVETVFINGHFDRILDFYHPEIIQHNPFVENTVPGLLKSVGELQKQGLTIQIEKIVKVLGEGNFVLICSEGKFANKPTAFFDLFRVENKLIVEHWDVLQEIPEKFAHENGFFEVSLYKRLGSYDGIAAYVDHAFPQVASDPELQHLFIGHATETKMRQRQLIIDKLVSALDGPTIYLGKPLERIHKGLNITQGQWQAFIKIMSKAMDERGISGATKEDFLRFFESFRSVTVEEELNLSN
jgi:predicted SnoaL-like aldol condensation-catalyzing enzyme/truncated hemoglobin YjbI